MCGCLHPAIESVMQDASTARTWPVDATTASAFVTRHLQPQLRSPPSPSSPSLSPSTTSSHADHPADLIDIERRQIEKERERKAKANAKERKRETQQARTVNTVIAHSPLSIFSFLPLSVYIAAPIAPSLVAASLDLFV